MEISGWGSAPALLPSEGSPRVRRGIPFQREGDEAVSPSPTLGKVCSSHEGRDPPARDATATHSQEDVPPSTRQGTCPRSLPGSGSDSPAGAGLRERRAQMATVAA